MGQTHETNKFSIKSAKVISQTKETEMVKEYVVKLPQIPCFKFRMQEI
jgi:hypothetical protein